LPHIAAIADRNWAAGGAGAPLAHAVAINPRVAAAMVLSVMRDYGPEV